MSTHHPPDEFTTRPRVLEPEEAEVFFEGFNVRFWTPHRDQIACRLMYEAGLRVSEAAQLQADHIEATPVGGRLVIRDGKGGRDRTVGLGRQLMEDLTEWLRRRRERAPQSRYAFPTSTGEAVSRQQLHRTVKRVARRVELREADRLSPHDLRHSFATRFLKEGGNLEELRRALGHSSLQITQKYLSLAFDRHVEAMQEQANGESEGGEGAPATGSGTGGSDPAARVAALEEKLAALKSEITAA